MSWVCKACRTVLKESGTEMDSTKCPVCGTAMEPEGPQRSIRNVTAKAFGRYELIEEAGVGHFGNVWRAIDIKLGREVALKIPRYIGAEASDQRMFIKEARAAAQLAHPGVVLVYEVGEESGCVYIVSEYLPGGTLQKYLKERTLSVPHAVNFAIQILAGLEHAHSLDMIHRDLKPGNILLTKDCRLKISDFGLAKVLTDEGNLTKEGDVLGTPQYMSPEQARGDLKQIGTRSDLYAFGVIFYEMLAGQRPFASHPGDFAHNLQHASPAPPSKFNNQVSDVLDQVCLKCLCKNPIDRYASASEIIRELSRWQSENANANLAETVVNPNLISSAGDSVLSGLPSKLREPAQKLASDTLQSIPPWRFQVQRRAKLAAIILAALLVIGTISTALMFPSATTDETNSGNTKGSQGDLTNSQTSAVAGADPSTKLPKLIRVRIVTDPPGAKIAIWGFHRHLGILDEENSYSPTEKTPVELQLPPGDYFVVAALNNGRFHEVLRRVPLDPTQWPEAARNRRYTYGPDNVTELRAIEIPELTLAEEGMARVAANENFTIGYGSQDLPKHQRSIPGFLLGTSEVTFGEIRKYFDGKLPLSSFSGRVDLPGDEFPAQAIMWNDAACIAEVMGKRLPFESEYEVAATNEGRSKFPWGDNPQSVSPWPLEATGIPAHDNAVISGVSLRGLYSNVAEWTITPVCVYPPPFGGELKPQLSPVQRIIRGGNLDVANGLPDNYPELQKGPRFQRLWFYEESMPAGVGFRCARSLRPRLDPGSIEKILP